MTISTHGDGGKGSNPRPILVDTKTYQGNWESIFGNKKKREQYIPPPLPKTKPE